MCTMVSRSRIWGGRGNVPSELEGMLEMVGLEVMAERIRAGRHLERRRKRVPECFPPCVCMLDTREPGKKGWTNQDFVQNVNLCVFKEPWESRNLRWRSGCLFAFVGTSRGIFAIAQLSCFFVLYYAALSCSLLFIFLVVSHEILLVSRLYCASSPQTRSQEGVRGSSGTPSEIMLPPELS